jgi:endoglucanase
MSASAIGTAAFPRTSASAIVVILSLLLVGCLRKTGPEARSAEAPIPLSRSSAPVYAKNRALGRGINFGNALEAPKEGEWGVTLRDADFTLAAQAGFQHVRIPVRWSAHALEQAPDSALAAGLRAIFNVHHYEEMASDPDAHKERLIAIWSQLAQSYKDYPDTVYFELFNEPNGKLTAEKNNPLIAELLAAVRPTNPDRAVIVGSVAWNAIRGLNQLELPRADHNLIVTFHYYDPFDFTHQGAPWVNKEGQLGIDWPGKVGVQADIGAAFNRAVEWANEQGRPLYLGEFGAYQAAEMDARVRWTTAVVEEANARLIPYAYWELRSGFGLYDFDKRTWRRPLLDAVLPPVAPPQSTSRWPMGLPPGTARIARSR